MRTLLILLVLSLTSCISSRYSCADVFNTKQEKLPWKYRFLKEQERSSKLTFPEVNPLETLSPTMVSLSGNVPNPSMDRQVKAHVAKLIKDLDHGSKEQNSITTTASNEVDLSNSTLLAPTAVARDTTILEDQNRTFKQAKTLGLISFATSIVGFLFFPLSIVGLVTGLISLRKYRKTVYKDKRIFGLLGTIFSGAWLFVILVAVLIVVLILGGFGTGWTF